MGAIHRSNGHSLAHGPGNPRPAASGQAGGRQAYNATGRRMGHEYMHRGHIEVGNRLPGPRTLLETNMLAKSRSENRYMSARLAQHLLNSTQGQAALGDLDNNVGGPQQWIRGIPVTDPTIYGFDQNDDTLKQVTTGAINIRKINDQLFIASVYPDSFSDVPDYELNTFFG
ncbi:hypothetical protein M3I53_19730 [Paraburkholderia sp. CNPSo 3272]|uniref:hypothetical protein n=1 Tax=Paraburkholderia sp. CNPSo 3272 TaxID=2940931 RepID=UPI0020B8B693|nr:hypothetical protein [Paraburkholderia sp. CNPSo 3272]MCP3725326.1 hypothetical protein [Paraburkholderia sp. CNPSo 3272]